MMEMTIGKNCGPGRESPRTSIVSPPTSSTVARITSRSTNQSSPRPANHPHRDLVPFTTSSWPVEIAATSCSIDSVVLLDGDAVDGVETWVEDGGVIVRAPLRFHGQWQFLHRGSS